MALISRLYDASAGEVLLDGADVRDVELRSLRGAVAVVSDDPFLFSATSPRTSPTRGPHATRRRSSRRPARQAHDFIDAPARGL